MAKKLTIETILSRNMTDMKQGTKIMMSAKAKMTEGRRELLRAERRWLTKAASLKRTGTRLKSSKITAAARKHKKSAIGMTNKVLRSMGR